MGTDLGSPFCAGTGGGGPSSRWWEGGWKPALACPSWQDGDGHGSGSSDFISAEAGSGASRSLNAMRATGGEGASPDSASHNTAFLPASRAGRSSQPGASPFRAPACSSRPQKNASSSIHTGNFLVPPPPSSVFWERALSWSLQRRPLPAGTPRDAGTPRACRISRCSKPVERSWLLKGREGQRAPSGRSCPPALRLGWQQPWRKSPGRSVPLAEVAPSRGCSSVGTFTGILAKPRRQRRPIAGRKGG